MWVRREDPHEGQVQGGVHRQAEAGAGEGVPEQPLHHHAQESRDVDDAGPLRETGEGLCPENHE